jgi:hypothetical protein
VAIYEFSRPGALRDYLTPPATGSQLTEAETASNGAYRSYVSGNWSAPGTWQTFDGTSWGIAVSAPSSTSGAITIRDGHTITVDKNVTADQVTVEAGAQVEVSPGVTWTIADGSDAIDCSIDGTLYNSGTVTTTGVLAFNSNSITQQMAAQSRLPHGMQIHCAWLQGSLILLRQDLDRALAILPGTARHKQ